MSNCHAARITLHEELFGSKEREIVSFAGMKASGFRYASGVAALRIAGDAGEVLTLPFQGQQIWDAVSGDRRLTMQTKFDAPMPTPDYLSNYGAFMIHCGVTAMGNPGPGDDHPLHGELPNVHYEHAWLTTGEDDEGPFMALSGSHIALKAFDYNYEVHPTLVMHRDHFQLELRQQITNARHTPLRVLYLLHLNFAPVPGSHLLDTGADISPDDRRRDGLPAASETMNASVPTAQPESYSADTHRDVGEQDIVDPELVLMLDPVADADGWAHAMQQLPDGSADFVSYRPGELSHAVRWIVRNPEMQALGLLLPATAAPNGRAAAHADGEGYLLSPGETFECTVRFGALESEQAAKISKICLSANDASMAAAAAS